MTLLTFSCFLLLYFVQHWTSTCGCSSNCFLRETSDDLNICTVHVDLNVGCDIDYSRLPATNFFLLAPQIVSIEIISGNQLQILFYLGNLEELKDSSDKSLTTIMVELADDQLHNRSCTQFNLQDVIANKDQFSKSTFQYELCDDTLQAGHNYTVYITYMPVGVLRKWHFRVPVNISAILLPSSMETWQTLVSISDVDRNSTIETYVQLPPDFLNITDLSLTLKSLSGTHKLTRSISVNNDSADNPALFGVFPESSYFATVSHCPTCAESISPIIDVGLSLVPEADTSVALSSSTFPVTATTSQNVQTTAPPASDGLSTDKIIIIVCVSVGAVLVVAVLSICAYCHTCAKQGLPRPERLENTNTNNLSFIMDDVTDGAGPSVLLLYSFDCAQHEQVVVEFATYLKHVFRAQIHLDIWEQNDIRQYGMDAWFNHCLETCQYCLVICSTGGRMRCRRTSPVVFKAERQVPDSFVLGVERLHEKIRHSRSTGTGVLRPNVGVLLFDYSSSGDIPHQLDSMPVFSLMKDLHKLYSYIRSISEETAEQYVGITVHTYWKTSTGRQLHASLKAAREFFNDNPGWLEALIERSQSNGVNPRSNIKPAVTEPIVQQQPQRNNALDDLSLMQTKSVGNALTKRPPNNSLPLDVVVPLEEKPRQMVDNSYHKRNGYAKNSTGDNGLLSTDKVNGDEFVPRSRTAPKPILASPSSGDNLWNEGAWEGSNEKEFSLKEEVDFIVNVPLEKYKSKQATSIIVDEGLTSNLIDLHLLQPQPMSLLT